MKIGIDLVEINRISKTISEIPDFVNKILSSEETTPWKIESICGKIAAKEAIIKTGFIQAGEWKRITILPSASGEPQVFDENNNIVSELHVSITHTSTLAMAIAVYEK